MTGIAAGLIENADRWTLPGAGGLEWRHWDDEVVVQVASTGSTHLLSGAGAAVFLTLNDARPTPVSLTQLADWLLEHSEGDAGDETGILATNQDIDAASLQATLLEFGRSGIAIQLTS